MQVQLTRSHWKRGQGMRLHDTVWEAALGDGENQAVSSLKPGFESCLCHYPPEGSQISGFHSPLPFPHL